jgi:hypothetical protein
MGTSPTLTPHAHSSRKPSHTTHNATLRLTASGPRASPWQCWGMSSPPAPSAAWPAVVAAGDPAEWRSCGQPGTCRVPHERDRNHKKPNRSSPQQQKKRKSASTHTNTHKHTHTHTHTPRTEQARKGRERGVGRHCTRFTHQRSGLHAAGATYRESREMMRKPGAVMATLPITGDLGSLATIASATYTWRGRTESSTRSPHQVSSVRTHTAHSGQGMWARCLSQRHTAAHLHGAQGLSGSLELGGGGHGICALVLVGHLLGGKRHRGALEPQGAAGAGQATPANTQAQTHMHNATLRGPRQSQTASKHTRKATNKHRHASTTATTTLYKLRMGHREAQSGHVVGTSSARRRHVVGTQNLRMRHIATCARTSR